MSHAAHFESVPQVNLPDPAQWTSCAPDVASASASSVAEVFTPARRSRLADRKGRRS